MQNKKIYLIKKIRNLTQISIDKCKKALERNNFNIQKTLIYLKKIKINNKNKTKQGIILGKIINNIALIIKITCETDFSSKNYLFINFSKKILNYIIKYNIFDINKINEYFKKKKKNLILKLNENININKIKYLKGKFISKYIHNNYKIGTILKINTINYNKKKINTNMKKICMHITAMNPKYIDINLITKKEIEKEKKLIIDYKDKKDFKKKLNKEIKKKTLLEQNFIFDNKILIKDFLNKENIKIIKYYRFKI